MILKQLKQSFKKSPKAKISAFVFFIIILVAVFGDFIVPHDPESQNIVNRLEPPLFFGGSIDHPLGTDNLGRDILSTIIDGASISIFVGVIGALLSALIAVPVALVAGYKGGYVDEALMRTADIFLSIPGIILAVAIIAFLEPSPLNVVIVFTLTAWPWLARAVRSEVLSESNRGYVEAAEALGASDIRIMFRHILPNVTSTALVITTLYIGVIILWQAALAFLGMAGSTTSWGWLLAQGRQYISTAWWLATFPGLAIFITVMSVNLLGDWLRDTLDVRTQ